MRQVLKTGPKARKFLSVFPRYFNSYPFFSAAGYGGDVMKEMPLGKKSKQKKTKLAERR
jgi:hypothetical protein